MNSVAPFGSILFDRPGDSAERDDLDMFRDLNLDQVFQAVVSGRDEYHLMPFFRTPLRHARAVAYRHEVQRDLETEPLSKAVAEFALRMREMRQDLEMSGKLRARYQKEHWLLDAARVYVQAVAALAGALDTIELTSAGFTRFRAYLADYAGLQAFTGLVTDLRAVTSALEDVRYCVNIKGNRVRVTKYETSQTTAPRCCGRSRSSRRTHRRTTGSGSGTGPRWITWRSGSWIWSPSCTRRPSAR